MSKTKKLQGNQFRETLTFKRELPAYIFLLPWILGILIFTVYPMVMSLYYSLCNYQLGTTPVFVGLQNYINMFADDNFWVSMSVTLRYVFIGVPMQLCVALILAFFLNRGLPGLAIFRAIYYLPSLLGGSVAIAILWRYMFGEAGVLNHLLFALGAIPSMPGHNFAKAPDTSLLFLIILLAWQFGSPMIIFLAGLKQIPQELYESASIDGAGRWKQFLKITMPMLSPIILFNMVMQIISAFQAFTPAFVVGGIEAGVLRSLQFYTLYLYRVGFQQFRMGYASALAWFLLIIIAVFTMLVLRTSRIWVYYDE